MGNFGNTSHKLQTYTHGNVRKSHTTIKIHQEDNKAKQPALSLFPNERIAKLEWTRSNAQRNMEQLQNTTTDETINNITTTLERTAAKVNEGA